MNNQSPKPVFVFDRDRCVGCRACTVGCAIKNNTSPLLFWRSISTYNTAAHPFLPVYHLSVACNHCAEAPCLKNCPAVAYSRDAITGAVLHDQDKCIGCRFCTWVCPYDAPKYEQTSGLIQKCDFCHEDLLKGESPSCVAHCPTGALQLSDQENKPAGLPFQQYGTDPSLEITGRQKQIVQIISDDPDNTGEKHLPLERRKTPGKINLKEEWPLIIFTLTMAWVVGRYAASVISPAHPIPFIDIALGWISLMLSGLHLGRKLRAPRAVVNIKNSPLSREIVATTLFMVLLTMARVFLPASIVMNALTLFAAFAALLSVDLLYTAKPLKTAGYYHSGEVLTTAVLVTVVSLGNNQLILILLALKLILFGMRYLLKVRNIKPEFGMLPSLRLWCLVLALMMILYSPMNYRIVLLLVAGELIDRILFYKELIIFTPQIQADQDVLSGIAGN